MVNQLSAALGMGVYVMVVLYATKYPYTMMVDRGMEPIRAVYYNRKIVHMFAGGVGSLSVPFLFTDVWYPMICGILLTALLYACLLYTSPSPRDGLLSRMPSSA